MGTTLRVGFAMGGGNSLGTFNGAALSQALKLLLLRGVDRRGEPYDAVEVDIFSGASAGSMSLALMLRGLLTPDSDRMMAAKVQLIAEFGAEFTQKPREPKRALIAAQILQDVQIVQTCQTFHVSKIFKLSKICLISKAFQTS